MRGGLAAAWFASLGLISWRSVRNLQRPPLPSEVLSTVVVFGGLSVISVSDQAAPVAALFGWGVVIAELLGFWPSGKQPGLINAAPPNIAKGAPQPAPPTKVQ